MNASLTWFRRFVVLGLLINLGFAIPALWFPSFLNTTLGLPSEPFYPWLGNAGMLLLGISTFYIPAAVSPTRWPTYTWLCALSRWIAVAYWTTLVTGKEYPQVFVPALVLDAVMGVLLTVTAQLGLDPSDRISLQNAKRVLANWWNGICAALQTKTQRATFGVCALLLAFVGYETWYFLLRTEPDPTFESAEEQFKYAPIGLDFQSRIPLYVFEALPEICHLKGGYASLGFVFEPGHDLPIGLAKRHIGYPSVEPNCSLCHTGGYQTSESGPVIPVPTGPANSLDLEGFQRFLYHCVGSTDFSADRLMASIQGKHKLGATETLFYRVVIYNLTKMAIGQQALTYRWQDLRPTQGKGRTDTFNPTKIAIFKFPDDGTIGTVDYPQIWNQRVREGMWLHWDGNNNKIAERNYAAAMAVGATPESVIPQNFKRVTDWLLDTKPPAYPFAIDKDKATKGAAIWSSQCADCHELGRPHTGQVTTRIEELGTDPHRLASFTIGLVDKFHTFEAPPFNFAAYRKTNSYSNTPTDGIWARAPYLHNGSVPTLWDLLQPQAQRPRVFYRGFRVYDPIKVGYVSQGPAAMRDGFRHDTEVEGNSNSGHSYGTALSDDDKWALIEYMKTL